MKIPFLICIINGVVAAYFDAETIAAAWFVGAMLSACTEELVDAIREARR